MLLEEGVCYDMQVEFIRNKCNNKIAKWEKDSLLL